MQHHLELEGQSKCDMLRIPPTLQMIENRTTPVKTAWMKGGRSSNTVNRWLTVQPSVLLQYLVDAIAIPGVVACWSFQSRECVKRAPDCQLFDLFHNHNIEA
jgi:hypothetical protein